MITIINPFKEWVSNYVDMFFIILIIYMCISVIVACQMFVISIIDTIFGTQIFNVLDNVVTSIMLILALIIVLGLLGCLLHDTITSFKKK